MNVPFDKRVEMLYVDDDECEARYKGCDIHIWRDATGVRNWYITVRDAGGFARYLGYWRDSSGNTIYEAIQEACRGSLLWTPT